MPRFDFIQSENHRHSCRRGSSLVMAMILVAATAIMIIGVMHGLTGSIIANEQASIDSELIYGAVGFAHLLRADMLDNGTIGSLSIYNMDGNDPRIFVLETGWGDRQISAMNLQYRIDTDGLLLGEQRVIVRAAREFNNFTSAVEVSVVISQVDLPFTGNFFGSNLAISSGLITKNPIYIRDDVTGNLTLVQLANGAVTHEGDIFVGDSYLNGLLDGGLLDDPLLQALKAKINTGADIPSVDFNTTEMMQSLREMLGGPIPTTSVSDSALPSTGGGTVKGVLLRFDGDKVYASTSNAGSDNAVGVPFGDEKDMTSEWMRTLDDGSKVFVLDLTDFEYVGVEGTYNQPTTIISSGGPIHISNSLIAGEGVAPMGLVSLGTGTDGNVYVRRERPGKDTFGFGYGEGSGGVIEAQIYAANQFDAFFKGSSELQKIGTLEFNGSIVAQNGGTDLGEMTVTRIFDLPSDPSLVAPGMEHVKISGGGKATFKSGSWGFNFNP